MDFSLPLSDTIYCTLFYLPMYIQIDSVYQFRVKVR